MLKRSVTKFLGFVSILSSYIQKHFYQSLLILTGIALPFRLILLDGAGLWFDEVSGVRIASYDYPLLMEWMKYEFSPPLFYLLMHLWTNVLGYSNLFLRIFPLIWGVLGVSLTGIVLNDIFRKKNISLLTTAMIALSPLMVRYSVEVRMYSLLYVVSLLQMMLFFRLLRMPSRKYAALLSIITAVALSLHHSVVFLFLVELIWAIIFYNRKLIDQFRYWLFVVVGVTILYLPILVTVTRYQLFRIGGTGLDYTEFAEDKSVIDFFVSFIESSFFGISVPVLGSLTIITIVIWGLSSFYKKLGDSENKSTIYFFILLVIIPIMFWYIRSGDLGMIRYFFPSVLSVYVIFAVLIEGIGKRFLKITFVGCLMISLVISVFSYYEFRGSVIYRKVDEIAAYVSNNVDETDAVFVSSPWFRYIFEWYYTGEASVIVFDPGAGIGIDGQVDDKLILARGGQQVVTEDNIYLLSTLVSPYERVWFIELDRAADPFDYQVRLLRNEYPHVKYVSWNDVQSNNFPGDEVPVFSILTIFEK